MKYTKHFIWLIVSVFFSFVVLLYSFSSHTVAIPFSSLSQDQYQPSFLYENGGYTLAFINGLNTSRQRASAEFVDLRNKTVGFNQARLPFGINYRFDVPEHGQKDLKSLFGSSKLLYNPSFLTAIDGRSRLRQFVASIALLIEQDMGVDSDEAWSRARSIFEHPEAPDVLEVIGQELGSDRDLSQYIPYVRDAITDLIDLNSTSRDSLRSGLINLLSDESKKIVLTTYSQGTIWTPILLNQPQFNSPAYTGKIDCKISTFQIANMTQPYASYESKGLYVTSDKDEVVNAVAAGIAGLNNSQNLAAEVGGTLGSPAPANIFDADPGHGLASVYLSTPGGLTTVQAGIADAIKLMNRPECYEFEIEFEQIQLPAVTRGSTENLVLRAVVKDAEGTILLDENGERVPIDMTIEAVRGTVTPTEGITDGDGSFRASAQISPNLPPESQYMLVTAVAIFLPKHKGENRLWSY